MIQPATATPTASTSMAASQGFTKDEVPTRSEVSQRCSLPDEQHLETSQGQARPKHFAIQFIQYDAVLRHNSSDLDARVYLDLQRQRSSFPLGGCFDKYLAT